MQKEMFFLKISVILKEVNQDVPIVAKKILDNQNLNIEEKMQKRFWKKKI